MQIEGRWLLDGHSYRMQVDGGICKAVEALKQDAEMWLAPGMVDLQLNGYLGVDYSSPKLTANDVKRVCLELIRRGTTRHLATIISSPQSLIEANLATIASAREHSPLVAAAIVGVHIEGPYISPQDGPRGVHNLAYVRAPSINEFDAWQQCSGSLVRLVTLAAEQTGAAEFISYISGKGVIASLGHSDATPAQMSAAVAAGAIMATHFGNGTKRQLPRFNNVLWWQLGLDQLYPSLISDGFHVDPLIVKVAARAKGLDKMVLVSDASAMAALPAGLYDWYGSKVRVNEDGHISRDSDGGLAGAGFLLDWCVPHFGRFLNIELSHAYYNASGLPAKLLNLPTQLQQLPKSGDPADFICFAYKKGDNCLRVASSFVAGHSPCTTATSLI